jgi:hypothetical protein
MYLNIIHKEKNEEAFWKYWQDYLDKHHVGSRYSRQNPEMFIEASKFRSLFFADKSFVALLDKEPAACVFLPIEKNGQFLTVTLSGGFVLAPLFRSLSVAKEIFSKIDEIAAENKIDKIMFSVDTFFRNNCRYNYLQKFDYLDASILSYVIDLNGQEEDFLKNCRRGHKCDIKKILADKNYEVFFTDRQDPSYEIHEAYRALHQKCSGRVTRPKENFDLQFEKLKNGEAVLFGVKYKGKNIAFSYFEYKGDYGMYEASADDPDYSGMPLYHILIFSAMKYLKLKGVRFLDTGQPSSPSAQFGYYPDEKQLNIALFKRGFGGDVRQNLRGVKYFSKELFEKDGREFMDKIIEKLGKINEE